MEMHTEGTTAKKGGAMHRGRHARGGKAKVQEYNAQGSNEVKEAEDETPDFKKGGHAKRKDGGMAEGGMAKMRLDKMPRGKREHHAKGGRAGGSPYSSGRDLKQMSGDNGREGVKVPAESD